MFSWFKSKKQDSIVYLRPMVSVRMEAIGGQGANSAGKILAEAAVLKMRYTGNHFSSFGSEKRGTPVRSFVRYSTEKKPVRSASFIKEPDLLVIFQENLIESHPEILEGLHPHSVVIVNTQREIRKIHLSAKVQIRTLVTIDATEISQRNKCGINAVMLGATSLFLPEINFEAILETLEGYFSSRGRQTQENNREGFLSARKSLEERQFTEEMISEKRSAPIKEPMGWQDAPIGGVIIHPGNMALKDHSASRKGFAPLFLKDVCFNCGFCEMVCPDYCFVWEKKADNQFVLQGLDYQYCKGCQKCIEVCPVNALVLVNESEIPDEQKEIKYFGGIGKTN